MAKRVNGELGREQGGAGRFFLGLLVVLAVVALAGGVVYLLSQLNHGRYRVLHREGELIVERGRFLPFGFEPYVPAADELARAYAAIPMVPGAAATSPEIFDDRTDVDRHLFSLLAGWAREALGKDEREAIERGGLYVARSELLPGLSEEQRVELRTLRGDLAYKSGQAKLQDSLALLEEAKSAFELAQKLGTSRPTDAAEQIAKIARRLADAEDHLPAPPDAPQPAAPEAVEPPAPPPGGAAGGKWRL